MNLDLRAFESFPAEATLEIEADGVDFDSEGISFKDLITVKLAIQEIGMEYFCQSYLSVPVEEECCRCLNLFDAELTGDFNFSIKIGDGEPVLSANEDNSDIICLGAGEHVADLSEVIREALILALPIKPLCSSDCKGLCPDCGANLNEESCDCKNVELDDRWEGLKGLSE